MTMKKLETPDFKSEAEEAAFWENNTDLVVRTFHEAAADGTLGHGTLAKKYNITPPTTIRLSKEDIELARTQAAARGLKYQTYLKSLIHVALRAEAAR